MYPGNHLTLHVITSAAPSLLGRPLPIPRKAPHLRKGPSEADGQEWTLALDAGLVPTPPMLVAASEPPLLQGRVVPGARSKGN